MKKSYIIPLIVLGTILLLLAISTFFLVKHKENQVLDETVSLFTNDEANVTYIDLHGNPISLSQYLGKIMVVASWASWSPFSEKDLVMLSELSSQYSNETVAFLAINRKETKEQATRYVSILPPIPGVVVALDTKDQFYLTNGGYAMPELLIYNNRGEVTDHFRGVATKEEIITAINKLLAQNN